MSVRSLGLTLLCNRAHPTVHADPLPRIGPSTHNSRLRAAITGQSGNYGVPPSEVSTMLHCGLVNHYFKGAYYPKGGGQRLSDRLAVKIVG